MIVTYSPEDGEPARYPFDPRKVRAREAIEVEQRYGAPWRTFLQDVEAGSMRARRVLLWFVQRREHPRLRLDDVPDFAADEVSIDLSAADLRRARQLLEDTADLDDDVRAEALARIDDEIAKADELEAGDTGGKASTQSAA